jgi:hypothetical protein
MMHKSSKDKKGFFRSPGAQSIIELAIFGAIVLFIIGGIVQQGFSAAYTQNQKIAALRKALLLSYSSSVYGSPDFVRNTATYMVIEDRLTPDTSSASGAGKYGATDRQPFMSMSSATLSNQLSYPLDWDEWGRVPINDLKVNGQDFRLAQAVFVKYRIVKRSDGKVVIRRQEECEPCACAADHAYKTYGHPAWRERLAREWGQMYFMETDGVNDVDFHSGDPLSPEDCRSDPSGADCWMYDMARKGTVSTANIPAGFNPTSDPNFVSGVPWRWNRETPEDLRDKIDADNGTYPSSDVDGDLVEETVYEVSDIQSACGAEYYDVSVLDSNNAELDATLSLDDVAREDLPGIKTDTSIESFMEDGTLFSIDGTQVKDPAHAARPNGTPWTVGSRISSLTQKNQIDVVTRVYQLNPFLVSTDNLCDRNRNPAVEVCCPNAPLPLPALSVSTGEPVGGGEPSGAPLWNCCAVPSYSHKTCLDKQTRILYIRSRVRDTRARHWVSFEKAAELAP